MAWTEDTPEYQEAIKRPTVRGGSFGVWLLRNDKEEINLVNVAYISENPATGTIFMCMNNGDRIPMTQEEFEMWERFITPSPHLMQMKLQEAKMREKALSDAAHGIVIVEQPLG